MASGHGLRATARKLVLSPRRLELARERGLPTGLPDMTCWRIGKKWALRVV